MNLEKLFEAQKELSQKIVETKGLQGKDLLDEKILALQVELGELANEWRGFKFWSEDQEPNDYAPNVYDVCERCDGEPTIYNEDNSKIEGFCEECDGVGFYYHNPLLEEYVDCLHFVLDIGNDLGINLIPISDTDLFKRETITKQFIYLNCGIGDLYQDDKNYNELLHEIIALGEMLGFTEEQIEEEYYRKNKINHARQENGY